MNTCRRTERAAVAAVRTESRRCWSVAQPGKKENNMDELPDYDDRQSSGLLTEDE